MFIFLFDWEFLEAVSGMQQASIANLSMNICIHKYLWQTKNSNYWIISTYYLFKTLKLSLFGRRKKTKLYIYRHWETKQPRGAEESIVTNTDLAISLFLHVLLEI